MVTNGSVPYLYFFNLDNFAKLLPGIPANDVAFVANLTIDVSAGNYQFCVESDDGAWLFVDNKLLVENGGVHAAQTVCRYIQLSGGFHSLSVNYFNGDSIGELRVSMNGSFTKGVPADSFCVIISNERS